MCKKYPSNTAHIRLRFDPGPRTECLKLDQAALPSRRKTMGCIRQDSSYSIESNLIYINV